MDDASLIIVFFMAIILFIFLMFVVIGEFSSPYTEHLKPAILSDSTKVLIREDGTFYQEKNFEKIPIKFSTAYKDSEIIYCHSFCKITKNSFFKVSNPGQAPVVKWGYGIAIVDFSKIPGCKLGQKTFKTMTPPVDSVISGKPYWVWKTRSQDAWKKGRLVFK